MNSQSQQRQINRDVDRAIAAVPLRMPRSRPDVFLCRLATRGPGNEPDFADACYWVQPVRLAADEETGRPRVFDRGGPFAAWHLAELFGAIADGDGAHMLAPSDSGGSPVRLVHVRREGRFWVFDTFPGPVDVERHFRVDCVDANGCPEGGWEWRLKPPAVEQDGPANPEICSE